jgi:hypothetical protein
VREQQECVVGESSDDVDGAGQHEVRDEPERAHGLPDADDDERG